MILLLENQIKLILLPNDWLAEVLLASYDEEENREQHDCVPVIVAVDQVIVVLVAEEAKLVENRAQHHF
jgi:hypothetical protein